MPTSPQKRLNRLLAQHKIWRWEIVPETTFRHIEYMLAPNTANSVKMIPADRPKSAIW